MRLLWEREVEHAERRELYNACVTSSFPERNPESSPHTQSRAGFGFWGTVENWQHLQFFRNTQPVFCPPLPVVDPPQLGKFQTTPAVSAPRS